MRTLSVFNQISLDGYSADASGNMGWAHRARDDAEWNAWVAGNASGGGTLLFGRTTYDLTQPAPEGVIDSYQIVVVPVVLGAGRTIFEGLKRPLDLRLTATRAFANGNVVLTYAAG